MMDIVSICNKQRKYFANGETKKIEFRIAALRNLQKAILAHEQDIYDALAQDLGKSHTEAYMTEIGLVLSEISYFIDHLKTFCKPKYHFSPLTHALSDSYTIAEPYGTVLIISPWNYPFQLAMMPLAAALAAGNTAVVKPSADAAATSRLLGMLIAECFAPEYVAVIPGGREENQELLNQHFDYIFFTGSATVGKVVLRKAAKYITPVTLELGGKNPCIVDATANIPLAAKRIVFGKFMNLGQTCVAPDYLLVEEPVKEQLITELKKQITEQFGDNPLEGSSYGKIINKKHFERIYKLYQKEQVIFGGQTDNDLRIEPTIVGNVNIKSAIMREEIFGPVLPIITFASFDEIYGIIEHNPHPLALYLFSTNDKHKQEIFNNISFGGGCINDTIMQVANLRLPFGGVGESGMGAYHGKASFDTFSHYKSVVDKLNIIDVDARYQPYTDKKYKKIRNFLK